MKFWENRKIAAVVLAVCVLSSVVELGGGSLVRSRASALEVFEEGSDPSLSVRFSMDAYLENCAGYARTMAEEFRLRVDSEDANAARTLELADIAGGDGDIDARYAAYAELCAAVESLYTNFYAAGISEEDAVSFRGAYLNFQGEVNKIEYDDYRAMARAYNRSLEGFPASIVAGLFGLGELNPF
ncbi:MAG TPA: hypothetical protein IAB50_04220 [Candidatus Faecivicinus avistercoris]|nr:hypothetical protein [Candidatus Faecivicinus avistercoris]